MVLQPDRLRPAIVRRFPAIGVRAEHTLVEHQKADACRPFLYPDL